jgi:hypothetical protein
MIQTKPLATRVEGGAAKKPSRVMKGVPASKGFASYMNGAGAAGQTGLPALNGVSMEEQTMKNIQGTLGLAQTKAMATLARVMEESSTPLQTVNSLPKAQAGPEQGGVFSRQAAMIRDGLEQAVVALRVSEQRKRSVPFAERMGELVKMGQPAAGTKAASGGTPLSAQQERDGQVGALAARFESGKDGIAAIGYDRHGGTSYGKYQLSSRAGSIRRFLDFLKKEEPEWAGRLERAGAANTGSRSGRMPAVWKQLAAEAPERFEDLQERFIRQSHFLPAVEAVAEKTGLAFNGMPAALQEVLFSTAVQHGPAAAARIISRAVDSVGQTKLDPDRNTPEALKKVGENLIRRIYALRSTQFGSSTPAVQNAVKGRLRQEMSMAITMLHTPAPESAS